MEKILFIIKLSIFIIGFNISFSDSFDYSYSNNIHHIKNIKSDENAEASIIKDFYIKTLRMDIEGQWNFYNHHNNLVKIENYKGGLKNGKWTTFYENGKIQIEVNYLNDKKNGREIHYDDKENIISESSYLNGSKISVEKDGSIIKYNDQGDIISKGFYKDGKLHGLKIEYSIYKGKLLEAYYKDGILHGQYIEYNWDDLPGYESIHVKGNHRDGVKDGLWIYYDTRGKIIDEIEYNADFEIKKTKLNLKNNSFEKDISTLNDNQKEPQDIEEWKKEYNNGTIKVHGYYQDKNKYGEWKHYYENGNIKIIENFSNGKRHGHYKKYYKNNKILEERYYNQGKLDGNWKWFYLSGNLWKIERYKLGVPIGEWICYFDYYIGHTFYKIIDKIKSYILGHSQINWKKKYSFGHLHGEQIIYGQDGKMKEQINYKYGKIHGEYVLYDNNEDIISSINFIDNKEDGKWIVNTQLGTIQGEMRNYILEFEGFSQRIIYSPGDPEECYDEPCRSFTVEYWNEHDLKKVIVYEVYTKNRWRFWSHTHTKIISFINYKNNLKHGSYFAFGGSPVTQGIDGRSNTIGMYNEGLKNNYWFNRSYMDFIKVEKYNLNQLTVEGYQQPLENFVDSYFKYHELQSLGKSLFQDFKPAVSADNFISTYEIKPSKINKIGLWKYYNDDNSIKKIEIYNDNNLVKTKNKKYKQDSVEIMNDGNEKIIVNSWGDTLLYENKDIKIVSKDNYYGDIIEKRSYIKNIKKKYRWDPMWIPNGEWIDYEEAFAPEAEYHVPKKTKTYYFEYGVESGRWEEGLTSYEYVDGKKNGKWIKYYQSGNLRGEGYYEDGMKTGVWIENYENGNIKSTGSYKKGRQIGQWLSFYKNGIVKKEQNYNDNGRKTGERFEYFDSGVVKIKENYINGQKEGNYHSYYLNNTIQLEGLYKNNRKHGQWNKYFEDGSLENIGNYIDNYKDGKWLYYYENGNLKKEENYKNKIEYLNERGFKTTKRGSRVGKWTHYYNNKNIYKIEYYDDKGYKSGKWLEYFENGQIRRETGYKDDKREGFEISYNHNGKIMSKESYHRGRRIK